MANRVMAAKKRKERKQRRAWARKYSIRSGIQSNREVIAQYHRTAAGLGLEEARTRFPNVSPGKKDISDRIEEILQHLNDPLCFDIFPENSYQRVRLFFNSKKTVFIIQHMNYKEGACRLSISYASAERAIQVWNTDKVIWKVKKSIPSSSPVRPSPD